MCTAASRREQHLSRNVRRDHLGCLGLRSGLGRYFQIPLPSLPKPIACLQNEGERLLASCLDGNDIFAGHLALSWGVQAAHLDAAI